MDRFFCPTLSSGTTVTLADEEFHHLAHVLRGKPGLNVELFDGQGTSGAAVVERVGKRDAQLSLIGGLQTDPPPAVSLVLGVACPKGDRLKWLVEKATELGVAELIPLHCERSVVEPRESKLARLEQTVLSACKQSRRNRLMKIGEPRSFAAFVRDDPVWVAHPGGDGASALVAALTGPSTAKPQRIRAAVGPEGGLTEAEIQQSLADGGRLISLGRTVLRVETAALVLAGLVQALAESP